MLAIKAIDQGNNKRKLLHPSWRESHKRGSIQSDIVSI
jgi:hypothetical protein